MFVSAKKVLKILTSTISLEIALVRTKASFWTFFYVAIGCVRALKKALMPITAKPCTSHVPSSFVKQKSSFAQTAVYAMKLKL